MTLTILKCTDEVFCRVPLDLDLFHLFFMPRNRAVGFWKTMCCVEDICHHHDSLLWMLVSVTRLRGLCLLHLLQLAFSAGQLQPLPPAFHAVLCGRKSPAQATLNDGAPPPCGQGIYRNCLEFFYVGDLCLLTHLFMNLITY